MINQYSGWISKQLKNGYRLEDVESSLRYFLKYKNNFQDRELNNYSAEKLEKVIKDLEFSKIQSLTSSLTEGTDYKLVYSDLEYNIFRIYTFIASQSLGRGTKWCITMSGGEYFKSYSKNGIFYFLIRKHKSNDYLNKVAAFVNYNGSNIEYYDEIDNYIKYKKYDKILLSFKGHVKDHVKITAKNALSYYKRGLYKEYIIKNHINSVYSYILDNDRHMYTSYDFISSLSSETDIERVYLYLHNLHLLNGLYHLFFSNPKCPQYIINEIYSKHKFDISWCKNITLDILQKYFKSSYNSICAYVYNGMHCTNKYNFIPKKYFNYLFSEYNRTQCDTILLSILYSINCNDSILWKIAKLNNNLVNRDLFRYKNCSNKLFDYGYSAGYIEFILNNDYCPSYILEKALKKDVHNLLKINSINRNKLSSLVLDNIYKNIKKNFIDLYCAILKGKNCSSDLILKINDNTNDYKIILYSIKHKNCPLSLLKRYKDIKDYKLRKIIASSSNIDHHLLKYYLKDKSKHVINAAMHNSKFKIHYKKYLKLNKRINTFLKLKEMNR